MTPTNKLTQEATNAYQPKLVRIRKKCFGCQDNFTCYQGKNYDYCFACSLNGNRYLNKDTKCPECSDGQGIIKFPNQPPRSCKTCSLTKKREENIFAK